MGILILSSIIATTVGVVIGQLIYKLADRHGRPKLGTVMANLVGFGVGIALFVNLVGWLANASTTTLIDMDPHDGEQRISFLGGPPQNTSDFCYRRSAAGVLLMADFNISEADFLIWMKSQKWETVNFDLRAGDVFIEGPGIEPLVYPIRTYETQTPLRVKRGYCYYHFEGKPGHTRSTQIIYDLDSGRAYVEFNSD